jgi:glycosyltransferase involved in cell wall biosynthesis
MAILSMGGQLVADSFAAVGFTHTPSDVAMVETVVPHRKYRALLVQSAWNVISRNQYYELMNPYPTKMKRRAFARRAVAHVNIRRAETVFSLTQATADLVRSNLGVDVRVIPVSLPAHDLEASGEGSVAGEPDAARPFALVPGSVTWYKRPELALQVVLRVNPSLREIIYCGADDRSGAWERVRTEADRVGVRAVRREVARSELYSLYRQARAIVLPSALETLGFALSEAMYLGTGKVFASAIPAHLEIAARVGGNTPQWIGVHETAAIQTGAVMRPDQIRSEWIAAAEALGLSG